MQYLIKKYIDFLEKNTLLSLILVLSLTLASLPFLLRLEVKPNFQNLLSENHQSVKNIKKLTEIYGGEGFLIIGLERGEKEHLIKFAQKIAELSQTKSSINYVVHRIDADFFKKKILLYMELEDLKKIEKRINKKINEVIDQANPFYIDFENKKSYKFSIDDIRDKYDPKIYYKEYLMDKSQTSLICLLKPNGSPNDVGFNRQLIRDVDDIINTIQSQDDQLADIQVQYGGLYYEMFVDNTEILDDIFYLSLLAIGLIIITLLLHYRRFKTLIIIVFPLGIGILLNFAVTQILIGHMNMLTGFLSGILMGLGLDFGIHIYSRYLSEKSKRPWKEALTHTLRHTGAASVGGALTTASAFYGMTIAEFIGFSEFGLIAGNGMVITSLSIILIFPLVIVTYEKFAHLPGCAIKGTLNDRNSMSTKGKFYNSFRYNYVYLRILFFFVLGFSLYFGRQVNYEYDFSRMQGASTALRPFAFRAESILNVSVKPTVVMSTNQQVIKELREIYTKNIKNHTFELMFAAQSIHTFIPEQQDEKLAVIGRLKDLYRVYKSQIDAEIKNENDRILLTSALKSEKITLDNLPDYIKREFVSKDGKTFFLIIHPKKYIYRYIPKHHQFDAELKSVQHLQGQFQPAGLSFILSGITRMINKDAPYILIGVLICLLLTIIVIFRRIKEIFIIFATLSFGILIMFGLMGFYNIKFNLLNVIAMPIILGIGIDGAIHICHRLREFKQEPTHAIVNQVYKVILLSSFTTALGFAILIGAGYTGLKSIGIVMIIGLVSVLLASLVFLPAFLDILYPKRNNSEPLEKNSINP